MDAVDEFEPYRIDCETEAGPEAKALLEEGLSILGPILMDVEMPSSTNEVRETNENENNATSLKNSTHTSATGCLSTDEDSTSSRTPSSVSPNVAAGNIPPDSDTPPSSPTKQGALLEIVSPTSIMVDNPSQEDFLPNDKNYESRVERRAEAQLPEQATSNEKHQGQLVFHEDAGRKTIKGCLSVTEADASINSHGNVTEGTIVFRINVRGTKRRNKIADHRIEEEAATIRHDYSQEIKQNHPQIYHKSDQVEPALMVEEESGQKSDQVEPVEEESGKKSKYHPESPRYYWEETNKYYRRASDEAIAKAWSAKPYQSKKPPNLSLEFSRLEEELSKLLLQPNEEETFAEKAATVQAQFDLYKPNLAIWKGKECILIAMLEKALELLGKKPKRATTSSKKRKTNSGRGAGGLEQEDADYDKHEGNHPSSQGNSSGAHIQGGSGSAGIQGEEYAISDLYAESDSDLQSSADEDDWSSTDEDDSDSSDSCSDDDSGNAEAPATHSSQPNAASAEPESAVASSALERTRMALEKTSLKDEARKTFSDEDTASVKETLKQSKYALARDELTVATLESSLRSFDVVTATTGVSSLLSFDDRAFYDITPLLRDVRRCETTEELIEMYETGPVRDCLDHIRTAQRESGIPVEKWAEEWARSLCQGDENAKALNQDRKLSLELLYTLCNRWKGEKGPKTLSAENVIDFGSKRIMGVLDLCLPMDRANALYNMTAAGESQPGMHWVSEIHVTRDPEWAERMRGYEGFPTMNKRFLWLMEADDLAGLNLGYSNFLRRYTTPKEAHGFDAGF